MQNIDIEKIMEKIKKDIKNDNDNNVMNFDEFCDENLLEIEEINIEKFNNNLSYIKNFKDVQTWRPYEAHSFLGIFKVIYKKIARKCVGFYVQPMILDQNQINDKMYEVLEQLYLMQQVNEKRIEVLQKKIKDLEKGRLGN